MTVTKPSDVDQETAEALLGGAHPSTAPTLILWGAVGQLPVAVVATVALRWLLAGLIPALDTLRARPLPVYRWFAAAVAVQAWPLATARVRSIDALTNIAYRGPPSF